MSTTPAINFLGTSTPIALRGVPAGALPASIVCGLSNGGVLTYNVEVTGADRDPLTNQFPLDNWGPLPSGASLTASAALPIAMKATAVRVSVTSYTSGSLSIAVAQ